MVIPDWGWRFENSNWRTIYPLNKLKGYRDITLEVTRPGSWRGPGNELHIEEGVYRPVRVRAYLESDHSINGTLDLIYIVEN